LVKTPERLRQGQHHQRPEGTSPSTGSAYTTAVAIAKTDGSLSQNSPPPHRDRQREVGAILAAVPPRP
jgi:hypothetical protein